MLPVARHDPARGRADAVQPRLMQGLREFVASGLTAALLAQAPAAPSPAADPFAPLAALSAQPSERHGLEVVVVDATGKPVPAAVLVWLDAAAPDQMAVRRAAEADHPGDEPRILAARAQRGRRWALDEQAATRVPIEGRGRWIACHDGLVASVVQSPATDPRKRTKRLELRLVPPTTTRVTVLTAAGQPAAGVPLQVLEVPGASPFPEGRTGADGTIDFRLLPRPATAVVECHLPLTTPVVGRLADAGPTGLTLRLPPGGALHATYTGELVPGSRIRWELVDDHGHELGETTGERTVAFPFVQAGLTGRLRCVIGVEVFGAAAIPAVVAGGRTEVEVPRDPSLRSIAVQLVGPGDPPVVPTGASVQWSHAAGSSSSFLSAGTEGWVELVVPAEVEQDIKLRIDARSGGWSDPVIGWAELDVGKVAAGRTMQGRVLLQAAEDAVSGMVVDDTGKPLAGIPLSSFVHSGTSTTTGPDGAFVLRVPGPLPEVIPVSLEGDQWFLADPTTSLEFAKGARDVRIAVRPAARVRLGARGLPDEVRSDFDCEVQPVEGGSPLRVAWNPLGPEMRVPAGVWHFVVKLGGQEVYRLENLRADAGVETHDPRFMDLDWRAFAALVTVRVQDRDGRPDDNCSVWHRYRNYGTASPPTGGVLHLLVDKEGGRISVEPDDNAQATVELGVVTGEHTIRIGGGPQLVVELSRVPNLPAGTVLTLRVGAEHEGVAFDAQGRAQVSLPKAGAFELHLGIKRGNDTAVLSWSRTVEVGDAGETLKIELTPELQKQLDDHRG